MNNEQLNKFQIFEDLSDENLSLFHDILKVVEIEKGKNFINEGDQGDSIYLLLKVRLIKERRQSYLFQVILIHNLVRCASLLKGIVAQLMFVHSPNAN